MDDNDDPIGDLLRDFYAFYGQPGEGPRPDDNVSQLVGKAHLSKHDLALLPRALNDKRSRREFTACRRVLHRFF